MVAFLDSVVDMAVKGEADSSCDECSVEGPTLKDAPPQALIAARTMDPNLTSHNACGMLAARPRARRI